MNMLKSIRYLAIALVVLVGMRCSEPREELSPVSIKNTDLKIDSPKSPVPLSDIDVVRYMGLYAQALSEDFSYKEEQFIPSKGKLSDEDKEIVLNTLAKAEDPDDRFIAGVKILLEKQPYSFRISGLFVPRLETTVDLLYIPVPTGLDLSDYHIDRNAIILPICVRFPWRCTFPPFRICSMGQSFGWHCFCHHVLCFRWFDLGCIRCLPPWYNDDLIIDDFLDLGLKINPEYLEHPVPIEKLPEGPIPTKPWQ